jgi:hypothetical protein
MRLSARYRYRDTSLCHFQDASMGRDITVARYLEFAEQRMPLSNFVMPLLAITGGCAT